MPPLQYNTHTYLHPHIPFPFNNRFTSYMTSSTSVGINLARKEMVILGTEYAGEMKKGIFSVCVSVWGF